MSGVSPEFDSDRLVKLLGMLGSNHAGERAVASLKADELVRRAGLTWNSLLLATSHCTPTDVDWCEPETVGTAIKTALAYRDHFNKWERRFIASVDKTDTLSPKQIGHIERLLDRARGIAYRPADYEGFD